MSRKPKVYLAFAAVVALMAMVPAISSASYFGYTAGGSISSHALETEVLKTNGGGTVKCTSANGSGTLVAYPPTQTLYLTVNYSGCNAFGFVQVNVSPAKYAYNANGTLDLLNEVVFNVPGAGCSVIVKPQSNLSAVTYTNNGNKLIAKNAVSGIAHTATNGLCGSSGTNGTLNGRIEIERVGGGTVWWEA